MAGLYYLSVTEEFTIGYGDLLQVIGALFWAIHLLVLDHYSNRVAPIRLAGVQFVVCGLLSLGTAFVIETPTLGGAVAGWQALLYAGLVSVGIGYTLQVVGQRGAHPAHAAIILSLETVFPEMVVEIPSGQGAQPALIRAACCAGKRVPPGWGHPPPIKRGAFGRLVLLPHLYRTLEQKLTSSCRGSLLTL